MATDMAMHDFDFGSFVASTIVDIAAVHRWGDGR
jgi:hypothetical protein